MREKILTFRQSNDNINSTKGTAVWWLALDSLFKYNENNRHLGGCFAFVCRAWHSSSG